MPQVELGDTRKPCLHLPVCFKATACLIQLSIRGTAAEEKFPVPLHTVTKQAASYPLLPGLLCRYLIETGFDTLAEAMFKAPFVCLAHNIFEEGVEDPLFTYANKAALELFEGDWDTLIGLPSRNSAEPESQEVRRAGFVPAGHS